MNDLVSESLNQIQQRCLSSAIYPKDIGLTYTALGLVGEAGEVANAIKKVQRDDGGVLTDAARTKLLGELGDVFWYLAAVAKEADLPLSLVVETVLRKLEDRKARGVLGGSGDNR